MRGLTLILAGADPSRFHAALSVAAASAAAGASTRLYLHGDAAVLVAATLPSPEDERHRRAGLPTLAEMLDEALALEVNLTCCQSGLALAGLSADALDPRIEIGGLVGLFAALGDDRLVMV